MWRSILNIVMFIVAWSLILAYILYASMLSKQHRSKLKVQQVAVRMVDSTATRQFATSSFIREELRRGGFMLDAAPIDSVNAVAIARYIKRNKFIDDVDVYTTSAGSLHIEVSQHEPQLRLLTNGYNSFITKEGVVFRAPKQSAYYSAVITGSYKPPFESSYEGTLQEHLSSRLDQQQQQLNALGEKFRDLHRRQSECKSRLNELKEDEKKGVLEGKQEYAHRMVGITRERAECHKRMAEMKREHTSLRKQKLKIEEYKKNLLKRYDDFANLTNFVTKIKDDDFWGAEVVQFVADTTSTGVLHLRLVPRSGNFIIEFGALERSEAKFNKLQEFYDKGLSRIGWERYSKIDLRYNKQVICTENIYGKQ